VGAKTILDKELQSLLKNNSHWNITHQFTANEGIQWKFIPPRSPHFGGLWEAGVKSVKHHLRRVTSEANLSFEEMYTLLTQIEACLNSRPLSPLSSDPNDYQALTPGHSLIGGPVTALPENNLQELQNNRLSRYQHVQQLAQHFWSRWSTEYLPQLQQRTKWKQTTQSILNIGDLVIIKDNNLPPCKWQLGRIAILHPGCDGMNRVATIRTSVGEVKRATVSFCKLPIE
jgi:hypothetical protein